MKATKREKNTKCFQRYRNCKVCAYGEGGDGGGEALTEHNSKEREEEKNLSGSKKKKNL